MVSYPAIYEDSVGRCQTVIARGRDRSAGCPSVEWRVPIRGVVFAGPLESLRAPVVPDERFRSIGGSVDRAASISWAYSATVLRRVGTVTRQLVPTIEECRARRAR